MNRTKRFQKWTSKVMIFFVTSFMVLGILSSSAKAAEKNTYAALGDSIAFGLSAQAGEGYVDLFYNYLKSQTRYSQLELKKLATPGDRTSELLNKLMTNADIQAAVSQSNIITVSIGGNNLMKPIIASAAAAFGVNADNNPNFVAEFAAAMASNPDTNTILMGLMKPEIIQAALKAGVEQFAGDWPQIAALLRTLAPEATIYVMTLYNPLNANDILYAPFDQAIQGINAIINFPNAPYKVVDVYSAFKNSTSQLTNFNILTGALDPHPTAEGHKVIFEAHLTPVQSISLDKDKSDLNIGDSIELSAIVAPFDATNTEVAWKSSDEKVASVDENGKVTALSAGTATITAVSADGNMTSECQITVIDPNIVPADNTTVTPPTEEPEDNSSVTPPTVEPADNLPANPPTGDTSSVGILVAICLISIAAGAFSLIKMAKK